MIVCLCVNLFVADGIGCGEFRWLKFVFMFKLFCGCVVCLAVACELGCWSCGLFVVWFSLRSWLVLGDLFVAEVVGFCGFSRVVWFYISLVCLLWLLCLCFCCLYLLCLLWLGVINAVLVFCVCYCLMFVTCVTYCLIVWFCVIIGYSFNCLLLFRLWYLAVEFLCLWFVCVGFVCCCCWVWWFWFSCAIVWFVCWIGWLWFALRWFCLCLIIGYVYFGVRFCV